MLHRLMRERQRDSTSRNDQPSERGRIVPGSGFYWSFGTVMVVPEYQIGEEPRMARVVPGGWHASIGYSFKMGRATFPFLAPIG